MSHRAASVFRVRIMPLPCSLRTVRPSASQPSCRRDRSLRPSRAEYRKISARSPRPHLVILVSRVVYCRNSRYPRTPAGYDLGRILGAAFRPSRAGRGCVMVRAWFVPAPLVVFLAPTVLDDPLQGVGVLGVLAAVAHPSRGRPVRRCTPPSSRNRADRSAATCRRSSGWRGRQ